MLKKRAEQGRNNRIDKWTLDNIQAGFEKFFDNFGHYPSATEIDAYEYLPTARSMQRSFGGLQSVRQKLVLRHDAPNHNSGATRSLIASKTMISSHNYESDFYDLLTTKIPELYVHEHKVLRKEGHKTDTDFFIYYPNSNNGFVVDIFYAQDVRSLMKQVRIKVPKYMPFPYETYFVCVNDDIDQFYINIKLQNVKTPIPTGITVCSKSNFFSSHFKKILKSHKW